MSSRSYVAGYVDLHAHVLPGVDDGPPDREGSLAMLRAAAASGIGTLAATPHLRADFPGVHVDELARRCRDLREACVHEGIDIRIVSGAEVSLVWALEASDEQLALATYDQRGTDLLIETPTSSVVGFESLLFQLRAKGLRVTLAHPERSVEFQRDSFAAGRAGPTGGPSAGKRRDAVGARRADPAPIGWGATYVLVGWFTRSRPTGIAPPPGGRLPAWGTPSRRRWRSPAPTARAG